MNRNILIFGGTHYFGKHLVKQLLANGDRVTLSTRGNKPIPSSCSFIPFDRDSNDTLRTPQYWDVIYDQSAYKASHLTRVAPVIGRCDTYVLTSSQAVYPSGLSLDETHECDDFDQINPYGLQKRRSERLVQQQAKRCIVPRFPVVVGEHDSRCRIQTLIAVVYTGRMVLPKSNPWLQLIDEHDTANALFELPLRDFHGAINVASPDSVSVQQLCTAIAQHLATTLTIEWLEPYPYEPFDLIKATNKTLSLHKQHKLGLTVKSVSAVLQQQCGAFMQQQRSESVSCRSAYY